MTTPNGSQHFCGCQNNWMIGRRCHDLGCGAQALLKLSCHGCEPQAMCSAVPLGRHSWTAAAPLISPALVGARHSRARAELHSASLPSASRANSCSAPPFTPPFLVLPPAYVALAFCSP